MSRRVAHVTGANGGIGRAIVNRLTKAGMRVVTLDVAGAADIKVDIARDPLRPELFEDVDICVSNAAIVDAVAPAHSMSAEKWERGDRST